MLRGHKLFCFNQWPLLYAVVQWNNCISHLILASAVLVFVDYVFNMAARSFLLKRLPWRYSVQSHSCWCGKGLSKKNMADIQYGSLKSWQSFFLVWCNVCLFWVTEEFWFTIWWGLPWALGMFGPPWTFYHQKSRITW